MRSFLYVFSRPRTSARPAPASSPSPTTTCSKHTRVVHKGERNRLPSIILGGHGGKSSIVRRVLREAGHADANVKRMLVDVPHSDTERKVTVHGALAGTVSSPHDGTFAV